MKWMLYQMNRMHIPVEVVPGRTGIHPDRLDRILNGSIIPTHAELVRIAKAINWGGYPESMLGEVVEQEPTKKRK